MRRRPGAYTWRLPAASAPPPLSRVSAGGGGGGGGGRGPSPGWPGCAYRRLKMPSTACGFQLARRALHATAPWSIYPATSRRSAPPPLSRVAAGGGGGGGRGPPPEWPCLLRRWPSCAYRRLMMPAKLVPQIVN